MKYTIELHIRNSNNEDVIINYTDIDKALLVELLLDTIQEVRAGGQSEDAPDPDWERERD